MVAGVHAVVAHAEGVRAVLEQRHARLRAHFADRVHLPDAAAHVAEHQSARVRVLAQRVAQVVDVDAIVGATFDVDDLAAGVHDRRWHRAERERVAQHLCALLDARSAERQVERRRARVDGDRVLVAGVRGERVLARGHRRLGARRVRVPKEQALAHQRDGVLDPLLGNGARHALVDARHARADRRRRGRGARRRDVGLRRATARLCREPP
mmetsp:Transcript_5654/g.17774  ORF Transcript_5654/g.17774 Transcript_5654/m.17774 type:complete len:211 (+) Transcript_5654:997-1629(+)